MATVRAWKHADPDQPPFPKEYEILKNAVLQVTDIKTNHNKYYALELHRGKQKGKDRYRVFTHYGRTDDLESNPEAGQKECRYADSLAEAEGIYQSIYAQKTSPKKGYKEVNLASTKIGSAKARGASSGQVDEKTVAKMQGKGGKKPVVVKSGLHPGVQRLVRYIYDEATNALTNTVQAKITAHGIETPLGVLTIGQVEKGEKILEEMFHIFNTRKGKKKTDDLIKLSGDFYTAIPHRIGRTRKSVDIAVIDTLEEFNEKQTTLQLMKDMLHVNGEDGNVLFNAQIDQEYEALKCQVEWLDPKCDEYRQMSDYVVRSQVKTDDIEVKNVYKLKRPDEWAQFTSHIGNHKHLFHGSRVSNWVGILSRGILLPKIVVSMGVNRTDPGWLGHGIYFGDAACTSAFYATPGRHNTAFMALSRVALGTKKEFYNITYGLNAPPKGYDSCHGVRCDGDVDSEFDDDEYVIYTTKQQRLEYLVEFTGGCC